MLDGDIGNGIWLGKPQVDRDAATAILAHGNRPPIGNAAAGLAEMEAEAGFGLLL